VLVLGQPRPTREFLRLRFPRSLRREEIAPILVKLPQNLLHHLRGELLVWQQVRLFEGLVQFRERDVAMLENVFLAQPIIGGIIDVLGGEAGRIDSRPQRIPAPDEVLFDQLHGWRVSHSLEAPP
jgi:hypothetical protein